MGKTTGHIVSLALLAGLLWGCSTPGPKGAASSSAPALEPAEPPDAVPTETPPSTRGNPQSYVVFGKRYYIRDTSKNFKQRGLASWYGPKFHGRATSSGIPFDMYAMTAAHKTLPLPTYVKVTHLGTGRSIVVEVNDRGPFVDDRVIDLSYAAAKKLGMVDAGTAEVQITALPPFQYLAKSAPATPEPETYREPHPAQPVHVAYQPAKSPPTSTLVHTPSPSTTPSGTVEKTGFTATYLQVGAFSQRGNAEKLQNRLAALLQRVIRIDSSTGAMHKVKVGPLKDTGEIQLITSELAHLGIGKPQLVFE